MNELIDFIMKYPATISGLMTVGWGVGVIMVSSAWGYADYRKRRRVDAEFRVILHNVIADVGHVTDVHKSGDDTVHMHCICGAQSLDYKEDDPTRDALMAQWEEEHIAALMESAEK